MDSENFFDYSNTIRALSIAVATFSIPMMYLVGRKFFDARYSLLLASLFAFEPHLNYNSGFGLSEPLFHLAIIGSFYFILNRNTRFVMISLLLAGIAYWIRMNGVFVFIVITIIYFITLRKSPNLFRNYGLGVVLFLLVISPVLIERNEEFGDPFYSEYRKIIFAGSPELMVSEGSKQTTNSALDYIDENGLFSFVQTFILQGIYNNLKLISALSFPYLFILIPFGIIFSMLPDRRHILFLLPLLMILSIIPIQRVTEYGLSTFSFSRKQKDVFIVVIIIAIIFLSALFMIRYGTPYHVLDNEKLEFSEYALNNLQGAVLRDWGGSLDYVPYLTITESPEKFKNYEINSKITEGNSFTSSGAPYGETLEELISDGEKYELKYIIANEKQGFYHPFTDELYDNYSQYPYLKKIFDSDEFGFKKLKIKVFEINYEKFHENEG
jgi:4-amino-4-deoxy-L-arabinose transferase-like glycosyltransferase